ncbi:hypothetical protein M2273_004464 [Mucilaginibacter lappiensis]
MGYSNLITPEDFSHSVNSDSRQIPDKLFRTKTEFNSYICYVTTLNF